MSERQAGIPKPNVIKALNSIFRLSGVQYERDFSIARRTYSNIIKRGLMPKSPELAIKIASAFNLPPTFVFATTSFSDDTVSEYDASIIEMARKYAHNIIDDNLRECYTLAIDDALKFAYSRDSVDVMLNKVNEIDNEILRLKLSQNSASIQTIKNLNADRQKYVEVFKLLDKFYTDIDSGANVLLPNELTPENVLGNDAVFNFLFTKRIEEFIDHKSTVMEDLRNQGVYGTQQRIYPRLKEVREAFGLSIPGLLEKLGMYNPKTLTLIKKYSRQAKTRINLEKMTEHDLNRLEKDDDELAQDIRELRKQGRWQEFSNKQKVDYIAHFVKSRFRVNMRDVKRYKQIESGNVKPTLDFLVALSNIYSCPVDYLFYQRVEGSNWVRRASDFSQYLDALNRIRHKHTREQMSPSEIITMIVKYKLPLASQASELMVLARTKEELQKQLDAFSSVTKDNKKKIQSKIEAIELINILIEETKNKLVVKTKYRAARKNDGSLVNSFRTQETLNVGDIHYHEDNRPTATQIINRLGELETVRTFTKDQLIALAVNTNEKNIVADLYKRLEDSIDDESKN